MGLHRPRRSVEGAQHSSASLLSPVKSLLQPRSLGPSKHEWPILWKAVLQGTAGRVWARWPPSQTRLSHPTCREGPWGECNRPGPGASTGSGDLETPSEMSVCSLMAYRCESPFRKKGQMQAHVSG